MQQGEFGAYLRELRDAKEMTQEQLGEAVGKKKMTISLIESGKNDPPQGDFLEKIILALAPSLDNEIKLRDLSALARNSIPSDFIDYFKANEEIRNAIRRAQKTNKQNADWEKIFEREAQ